MSNMIEVSGIILKSNPVSEHDRHLTILTMERGKIYCFARGARKQGSAFMGTTTVFIYAKFRLYEGRNSYSLQSVEVIKHFEELMLDIESTCYASYFLELTDYYTREYIPDVDTLKLLYLSLLAILKSSIPNILVRRIFELRMMTSNGDYEELSDTSVHPTTRYTWNYIVESPLEKLYTFTVKEQILSELSQKIERMRQEKITKTMNTLEVFAVISS